MKRVAIESPYSGDTGRNTRYAQYCLKDCLIRGEAPIASHLLHPQVLDDTKGAERSMGIKAGFEWNKLANAIVVYCDFGITKGMLAGIKFAKDNHVPVENRVLPSDLREEFFNSYSDVIKD